MIHIAIYLKHFKTFFNQLNICLILTYDQCQHYLCQSAFLLNENYVFKYKFHQILTFHYETFLC